MRDSFGVYPEMSRSGQGRRLGRRMPHTSELGIAFRTTRPDFHDLIRELRRGAREGAEHARHPDSE